jgi:diguanylate cyclase (GGDEF)-like protein
MDRAEIPLVELFESNPMGIVIWKAHGDDPADLVLRHANKSASTAIGIDLEPKIGMRMADAFPAAMEGEVGNRLCDPVWQAAVTGRHDELEFEFTDEAVGVTKRWLRNAYVPLGDSLMAVHFEDVSEKKAEIEELAYVSVTDSLTGLENRRGILYEAEKMHNVSVRHHISLVFVAVDMDNLKPVNDFIGHGEGDRLLKTLAETFTQKLRKDDRAGRIGGDEFLLLLPDTSLSEGEAIANRIRATAAFDGVTAGFGVAMLDHGESVTDLMKRADVALYLAKKAGGNRVVVG